MPRRTDIFPILVIGAGPFLALTPVTAHAETTTTSTPVGRLTLVREHYVHEGTPILHVPEEWKKNRLEWLSSDRRVRLFLEDDGAELAPRYAVSDARHPEGEVCLGEGLPQAFQGAESAVRRWRSLAAQFEGLLRYCVGWIDEPQRRSYVREFAGAAGDFATGLELLRQAATEDFGGWRRRCLKSRINHNYSPFPRAKCLRYSAKAN